MPVCNPILRTLLHGQHLANLCSIRADQVRVAVLEVNGFVAAERQPTPVRTPTARAGRGLKARQGFPFMCFKLEVQQIHVLLPTLAVAHHDDLLVVRVGLADVFLGGGIVQLHHRAR